jgi:hypothetical protein
MEPKGLVTITGCNAYLPSYDPLFKPISDWCLKRGAPAYYRSEGKTDKRLYLEPNSSPFKAEGISISWVSPVNRDKSWDAYMIRLSCPDHEKLETFLGERRKELTRPADPDLVEITSRGEKVNKLYILSNIGESLDCGGRELLQTLQAKFEPERVEALRRKGIEPRFNLLFAGIPGSGKTYFAAIIAKTLSRPIYKMTADDLSYHLGGVKKPAVIVIEDADANGAKQRGDGDPDNGYDSEKIGNILEYLDGTSLGHLFIVTTNYPERLDVAVVRSERFSMIVEFGYASEEAKKYIIRRYFDDFPDVEGKKATDIVYARIRPLRLTNAQLTTFCSRRHALSEMPTEKDYGTLITNIATFDELWKSTVSGIKINTN